MAAPRNRMGAKSIRSHREPRNRLNRKATPRKAATLKVADKEFWQGLDDTLEAHTVESGEDQAP